MSDELPNRIGDYQVLAVLGAGGMGKVYKVRNVLTERVEAMKILLPDLAGRRELAERFLREIKILAGLSHPNIAQLRTALTCENQLLMIMEYVEGVTLAARVKQGPLDLSEAVFYVDQVLAALAYAHGLHVIHRDIKPANMMVTPDNVVKLMDFGIARSQSDPLLTAAGTTVGSLYYMAPEQLRSQPVNAASDLFSVGVSLYELATGRRPFQADTDAAVITSLLQDTPAPPADLRSGIPAALNDIILQAMQKDPAQRFQSAETFREALKNAGVRWPGVPEKIAATDDGGETLASATPTPAVLRAIAGSAAPPAAKSLQNPRTVQDTTPPARPGQAAQTQSSGQPGAGVVAPSPARRSSTRLIYMAIGVLVAAIVLAAAGLYLPRLKRGSVAAEGGPVAQPVNTPEAQPRPALSSAPADLNRPGPASEAVTNASPVSLPTVADKRTSNPPAAGGSELLSPATPGSARTNERFRQVQQSALNTANQPSPQPGGSASSVDRQQLAEVDHELDLLSGRAEAVNASLETLQQSQAAQGLGLRGDVVASRQRMRLYLSKAQAAVKEQDLESARKYVSLTETEVSKLEKFLGR